MGHGVNVTEVCKYLVCNFDLCAAGMPLPSAFVLIVIDYVGFSVVCGLVFFFLAWNKLPRLLFCFFASPLQLFKDAMSSLQTSIF